MPENAFATKNGVLQTRNGVLQTTPLTLFDDGFEDGALGPWTWVNPSGYGSLTVQSTDVISGSYSAKMDAPDNDDTGYVYHSDWTDVDDVVLRGDAQITIGHDANGMVLTVRSSTSGSKEGYMCYASARDNTWEIRHYDGAGANILASQSVSFSTGTTYSFEIRVEGTDITATFDGGNELTASDSNIASGALAFEANECEAIFDNLYAEAL